MSLAINSSTPAFKQGSGTNITSITSNAFSPPAGSTIFVFCTWGSTTSANPSITDSLTPDLTWNDIGPNLQSGMSEVIYAADCPVAQTNMTVTVSWDQVAPAGVDAGLGVVVMTGAAPAASQPGNSHFSFATSAASSQVTTSVANSWVMGVFRQSSITPPTLNAGQVDTFGGHTQLATGTGATSWIERTNAASSTIGTVVNLGATAPSATFIGAAVEILPAPLFGIDASTPAYKQGSGSNITSVTSNAFSPPAGSLIVVFGTWRAAASSSISDSLSPSLSWVPFIAGNNAAIYAADCPTAKIGMTVTLAWSSPTIDGTDTAIGVIVFTGAAPAAVQPGNVNYLNQTGLPDIPVTTTIDGSWVMGSFHEASTTPPTFNLGVNDTFNGHVFLATGGSYTSWVQSTGSPTPTAGTKVFLSSSSPSAVWTAAAAEILPNTPIVVVSDSTTISESLGLTDNPVIFTPVSVAEFVHVVVPAAGGGVALSRSVSDSTATSEAFILDIAPSITEALTLSVTDSTTISESKTVTKDVSMNPAVVDSITTSEFVTLTNNENARVSDSIVSLETVLFAVTGTINLLVSDSTAISESVAISITTTLSVSDSTSTSESPTVQIPPAGTLVFTTFDPSGTAEFVALTLTGLPALSVTASDSTTTSESRTVQKASVSILQVVVRDATGISEVVVVTGPPSVGPVTIVGFNATQVIHMTIARMNFGPLDQGDRLDSGQFGVDNTSDLPYFDTAGASSGEAVAFAFDGATNVWCVTSEPSGDVDILRIQVLRSEDVPTVGVAAMPPEAVAAPSVSPIGVPAMPPLV